MPSNYYIQRSESPAVEVDRFGREIPGNAQHEVDPRGNVKDETQPMLTKAELESPLSSSYIVMGCTGTSGGSQLSGYNGLAVSSSESLA